MDLFSTENHHKPLPITQNSQREVTKATTTRPTWPLRLSLSLSLERGEANRKDWFPQKERLLNQLTRLF
jgi:hypothetical protein